MIGKFVMFIKPTRLKIVVTAVIALVASLLFCGYYTHSIPEVETIWVSPLLFPTIKFYKIPERIEWEEPENIPIPLPSWVKHFIVNFKITLLPPSFPRYWLPFYWLFQKVPKLFVLLFFTNLPYWYFMACILEPFLSRFLKPLEAKLKPEGPVTKARLVTFASIFHLLGGIFILFHIIVTDAHKIVPFDFYMVPLSMLFIVNFLAAIFMWYCLKHKGKLSILVFTAAFFMLGLPWEYSMPFVRVSTVISMIPLILLTINRLYYKK